MNSTSLEPRRPSDPQPAVPSLYTPGRPRGESNSVDTFDLWFAMDFRNILRRRWPFLVVPTALLLAGVLIYSAVKKPVYEADATVLLQWRQTGSDTLSSAVLGTQMSSVASLLGVSSGSSDLPTQMQVLTSDEVMNGTAQRLHLKMTPDEMRKEVTVTEDKLGGNILDIQVKDESAQTAHDIALAMIDVYQKTLGAEDATVLGRSAGLVRQQMSQAARKLADAETKLQLYSARAGTVDPETENTKRVEMMYSLQHDYLSAQQKAEADAAERDYYAGQMAKLPAAIVPNLTFQRNPRIDAAKQDLNTLQAERARLITIYTPKDDEVIQVDQKIAAVRRQIIAERQSEDQQVSGSVTGSLGAQPAPGYVVQSGERQLNPVREDLRGRVIAAQAAYEADTLNSGAIKQAIGQSRAAFASVPGSTRRMFDLRDDVTVLGKIYDALRVQLNDLEAKRGTEQVYAEPQIYPLVPKYPVSPKPLLYSAVAIVTGLLIGVLAMLGVETSDKRLRNNLDVQTELGLPILATISRIGIESGKAAQRVFDAGNPSQQARRLANALAYLGLGKSVRTLMVTSAVKGEGVTLIASELAVAIANEGKRVILVDANLRSPSLHTFFGLANSAGLAGAMRNGAAPEKALVPLAGGGPLQLVPSGELDNESVGQVLNSDKLAVLLAALRERADVVIIDAPAVLESMETATLAERVDATILVTAIGVADREDVRRALELLSASPAPVLGAVLNEGVANSAGRRT